MKKNICVSLGGLIALLLFSGSLMAQQLGFNGVGGTLHFVKPEDSNNSVGFGAHVDLGEVVKGLHLFPSIEYFNNKADVQDFFGTVEAEASVTSINGDVRYYFPSSGKASFFAGGGVGLHLTGSTKVQGQKVGDSQSDVGLNLMGGVDVPMNEKIVLTGFAKFVVSDNNGVKVGGGITYLLGR
ncbi:MAG: outer membrane beta-barrel protein [bacterium]